MRAEPHLKLLFPAVLQQPHAIGVLKVTLLKRSLLHILCFSLHSPTDISYQLPKQNFLSHAWSSKANARSTQHVVDTRKSRCTQHSPDPDTLWTGNAASPSAAFQPGWQAATEDMCRRPGRVLPHMHARMQLHGGSCEYLGLLKGNSLLLDIVFVLLGTGHSLHVAGQVRISPGSDATAKRMLA